MLHAGLDLSRRKVDVCLLSGAGHRLDHRADGLGVNLLDPAGEGPQRLTVGWRDELVEVFSRLGEQADIELAST